MLIFNDLLQLRNKKKKINVAENKKNYIKNHSEINRRKKILINFTKKIAQMLISNDLLQLRKKQKNKYNRKEKRNYIENYSEMNRSKKQL